MIEIVRFDNNRMSSVQSRRRFSSLGNENQILGVFFSPLFFSNGRERNGEAILMRLSEASLCFF